ncbi:DUF2975 domain-containing protein [Rathayibacter sp. YIM 133350]|uniref:DUF2975 domain-containing protein n=1 Tax=Rathayibacter sp. YIM 133350 TaxID=3131992 RepID=UPI00307FB3C3
MNNLGWVVVPFRVLLVLVFLGLLMAELLSLPGQFSHVAGEHPELGAVPWMLLTLGILEAIAIQIVIVCTWRLLTLVRADRIFSAEAFAWVDVIVWTMLGGWLLFAGVAAYFIGVIYFTPELRDPGTPVLLTGMALIGGVVVLTIVLMRALLRQATVLRSDWEAVI